MLTPLWCIVNRSKSLGGKLKHFESSLATSAELICITGKLLLALANDNIERSLTGKRNVEVGLCPLNRIIDDVIEIVRPLAKGDITFEPLASESVIELDQARV